MPRTLVRLKDRVRFTARFLVTFLHENVGFFVAELPTSQPRGQTSLLATNGALQVARLLASLVGQRTSKRRVGRRVGKRAGGQTELGAGGRSIRSGSRIAARSATRNLARSVTRPNSKATRYDPKAGGVSVACCCCDTGLLCATQRYVRGGVFSLASQDKTGLQPHQGVQPHSSLVLTT